MTRPASPPAPRTRRASILALAAGAVTALVVAAVLSLAPTAQADHVPIHGEVLTQGATFTDDVRMQVRAKPDGRPRTVVNLRDPSDMTVMEITIQPGAMFPWHTHPGPVFVAIERGDFVFVFADDCVRRDYTAGNGFVDLGVDVHMAYNPSTTEETVVYATFLGVGDGPVTVPVDAATGAELDERCEIDRP